MSTTIYSHFSVSERSFNVIGTLQFVGIGDILKLVFGLFGQSTLSCDVIHQAAARLIRRTVRLTRKLGDALVRCASFLGMESRLTVVEFPDVQSEENSTQYNGGAPVKPGIPEEDLFQEDTEQWLRKFMPHLSEEQIEQELQTVRMLSLLEFYESVAESYPELLEKLPKIPRILVARP